MKIAVIVPTFQKRKTLRSLLRSLRMQSNKNFKVIIVDNNEDEEAQDFIQMILSDFRDLSLFHIKSGVNLGAGGGRNFGATSLEAADCDIFAFIDDDCEASESWLKTINEHFELNKESQVIYGRVTSDIKPNPPFIHGFDMQGGVFGSGNCAIRKEFFIKMGGFDTYLNNWAEDFEIGERCKRFGTSPIYLKEMLVNHPPKILNYDLTKHILTISFYKKFLYITKVRGYEYKSPFKKSFYRKALIRFTLFVPLLFLGLYNPILIVTPFTLSFILQVRKVPSLLKSLSAYPFDEKIRMKSLFNYFFLSWLVDIFNGGLLVVYSSPILEKTLIQQIKGELLNDGLEVGQKTNFLT